MSVDRSEIASRLWRRLREALIGCLKDTDNAILSRAWQSRGNRTACYAGDLIPRVAERMELVFKRELFTVDYALLSPDTEVPVVFIESENDAVSASDEVRKLSLMAAPVKMLITCVEWDDSLWPEKMTKRKELLGAWRTIVERHSRVWPEPAVFAVVVGEWDNSNMLRFYAHAFDCRSGAALDVSNGRSPEVEPVGEAVIFQRHILG